MATRSAALIKHEGNYSKYYYRHWDGYPTKAGADLLSMVEALKWNPDIMASVLESRYRVSEANSKEGSDLMSIDFPAIGFEDAEGLDLDDLDYFYLIDCDRKELRCYENMFRIDAHNLASLPPYKILKWSNTIS